MAFTRKDNERLDAEYNTSPRSPLHTSNRFPESMKATGVGTGLKGYDKGAADLQTQHDHEDGLHAGGSVDACPDCSASEVNDDRIRNLFKDRRG